MAEQITVTLERNHMYFARHAAIIICNSLHAECETLNVIVVPRKRFTLSSLAFD